MIPTIRIMANQAAHAHQRTRHRGTLALGLAIALLAALALAPAPVLAAGDGPLAGGVPGCAEPQYIVETAGTVGQPFTLTEAVDCLPAGQTWTSAVIHWGDGTTSPGTITHVWPASREGGIAALMVTGEHLYSQPGSYPIGITVTDQAGQAYEGGWHTNALIGPPATRPEGLGPATPYEAEVFTASMESAEHQAAIDFAKTEAERHQAKEQEEQQHAAEMAARRATEETELQHAEEREAKEATEREEQEHPACRVPALKGDTLAAARRALRRAHCRLGAIHRPTHHHDTLYVSAQGAPAGEQLAHGARVMLTLGAKRASRRGGT